MPKESNLELKVGLFVLLALLGLTVFIFSISDTSVFEKGRSFRVIFNFANGLKKSAPVCVAGVEQGIVRDINLFYDREDGKTKAEVILWVKKNTQIPADSSIVINQLGLLGEKYVEIMPGLDTKNYFHDGETHIGKDPISQEALSERVMDVARKMESAISGINVIVSDKTNQESINKTLQNLSAVTGGINDVVTQVKTGQGTVGHLFYDDRLYDDLQALTSDLKANPWKLLYRPKGNVK